MTYLLFQNEETWRNADKGKRWMIARVDGRLDEYTRYYRNEAQAWAKTVGLKVRKYV
jgi:hypothetical protein